MGHSPSRVPDSLGVKGLACSGERVGGGGNGSTSGEVKEGALHLRKIPEAQVTSKPDAANFQLSQQ